LPSDEAIIEVITSLDILWDDVHHRSYFLLELIRIEVGEFTLTMTGNRYCTINPLATHVFYAQGNMETIIEMISIDIYRTPGGMENVLVGANCSPEEIRIYTDLFKEFCNIFTWSYEEMLDIDPRIVEHEIMTYPDANLV
jgi:hypothetical protein